MKLTISEIFHSVQGEGFSAGLPALFVRTMGCDLTCRWCDAYYTWDSRRVDLKKESTRLTPEQVVLEAEQLGVNLETLPLVVLTGGEPMLQQAGLARLLGELKRAGFRGDVEVETNGRHLSESGFARRVTRFNVSPKLANSGIAESDRLVPEVLEAFSGFGAKACFKFVICRQSDVDEVRVLQKRFKINRRQILLMPEGTTSEELIERGRWLVVECQKDGFCFCDRLHIHLFGNQRGR